MSVTLNPKAIDRPRAPRPATRHTWAAELRDGVLRVFRGTWDASIDRKTGDSLGSGRNPRLQLHANIGDRLVVAKKLSKDHVTIVRVVDVDPSGDTVYRVERTAGDEMPEGGCWVMKLCKERS